MITIVNYGLGNVQAFLNLYRRLNIEAYASMTPHELRRASKIILPGVGAFDHAMELLNHSGMRDTLDELVLGCQVPILGVCVGMQILGRSSDEGRVAGLRWIEGEVKALNFQGARDKCLPLPHMGWNDVSPAANSNLFKGLEDKALFYFLHSYYFCCDHHRDILATTAYGVDFACAINARNVYGVQFHPEKSHAFGTKLLKNFAEI